MFQMLIVLIIALLAFIMVWFNSFSIRRNKRNTNNTGSNKDAEPIREPEELKTLKKQISYLVFDTETTGLPKSYTSPASDTENWPRMVQLACGLYDDQGILLDHINFIIKPEGYSIPPSTAKVHGITTARAKKEGVDLADILIEFEYLVNKADILVCHSADFDKAIVGAEFYRKFEKNPLEGKLSICTMTNPKVIQYCQLPPFRRGAFKWPKLVELHQRLFETDFDRAHQADGDMEATARCFFELKKLEVI